MNPVRLRATDDVENVRRMLLEFYSSKPPEYDLINREQQEYDRYAAIISKYCGKNGRVLDFGSGTWRSPKTIAELGFEEVIGCDFFTDQEIETSKNKLNNVAVKLVKFDGRRLPFPDGYFDTVTSLCVLEHVLDIESTLRELARVLKPGGVFIIVGPNWSGLNNPIKALYVTLINRKRYWMFENPLDAFLGIARVFAWYGEVLFAPEPAFLMIKPRAANGRIIFETGDDDCVHLCHPLSFRKWFAKKGYAMLQYNRGTGHSSLARWFNTVLPSLATTNVIVARKGE